jgi:hypothetical protein
MIPVIWTPEDVAAAAALAAQFPSERAALATVTDLAERRRTDAPQ